MVSGKLDYKRKKETGILTRKVMYNDRLPSERTSRTDARMEQGNSFVLRKRPRPTSNNVLSNGDRRFAQLLRVISLFQLFFQRFKIGITVTR